MIQTRMSKRTSVSAWNLLRHSQQLWTRKRKRLVITLDVLSKVFTKLLLHSNKGSAVFRKLLHSKKQRGALIHGEREFSFGTTPTIHVKMHRPSSPLCFHIPCIKPHKDFTHDDEPQYNKDHIWITNESHINSKWGDDIWDANEPQINLKWGDDNICNINENGIICSGDVAQGAGNVTEEEMNEGCDKGIDSKAEEFIAKFYQQMKLQCKDF